ncbi:MAG: hypothetical protein WCG87_03050 [Bacteroidota bacterium]
MQTGLLDLHNLLRWIIVILALFTIVNGLSGMISKKLFKKSDQRIALFLLISCDIQLLVGITIYFVNDWWNAITGEGDVMGNTMKRFFSMEHTVGMILAIVLVHVGYATSKSATHSEAKFKRLFWYTLFAVIVIAAVMPWPFRAEIGRPWFPGMHHS